ncbi:hypothetical protein WJX72_007135 [[Myrmecia] bisecta]|uniref:AAA+ ATPase domain-containing protein n=1 Tax=[Myrmecia] bisecta TaxID=41462 RepID=A0AAW1PTG1_9CHLO
MATNKSPHKLTAWIKKTITGTKDPGRLSQAQALQSSRKSKPEDDMLAKDLKDLSRKARSEWSGNKENATSSSIPPTTPNPAPPKPVRSQPEASQSHINDPSYVTVQAPSPALPLNSGTDGFPATHDEHDCRPPSAAEATTSTSFVDDIEAIGGLVLPIVLGLADKLPPPGPLAAKVLEGIVSYAAQACYNKKNCIALSQRAQVLLKVLCENWAAISCSSSCQEMLARFMDTLQKVQAFVQCFTEKNLLRRGLHCNDDKATYESLWECLNVTRSDFTAAMVAAIATSASAVDDGLRSVVTRLETLHTEVLRYQGQEQILQHAIEEQGGWSKVMRDPRSLEAVTANMGIEWQLLMAAYQNATVGPLRSLSKCSPEMYRFWQDLFGSSPAQSTQEFFRFFPSNLEDEHVREQLREQFANERHQQQFLANLPDYDGNLGMISLLELSSAIEQYRIHHPGCGFVDLMLGLSSPSSRRSLFTQPSVPSYKLECRVRDVEKVFEEVCKPVSPRVVAIAGAPGQGLTTVAKELSKRCPLSIEAPYIDLKEAQSPEEALMLIRKRLQSVPGFDVGDKDDDLTLVSLLRAASDVLKSKPNKSGELVVILDHAEALSLKTEPMRDLPASVALVFTTRNRDHNFKRYDIKALTLQDAKLLLQHEAMHADQFYSVACRDGGRDVSDAALTRIADACGCMPLAIKSVLDHVDPIWFEELQRQKPGWLAKVKLGNELSNLGRRFADLIWALPRVEFRSRLLSLANLPPWFTAELVQEVLAIGPNATSNLLKELESRWLMEYRESDLDGKLLWRAHPLVRALADETYECEDGALLWPPEAQQELKLVRNAFVPYCQGKLQKAQAIFAGCATHPKVAPNPQLGLKKLACMVENLQEALLWVPLERPDDPMLSSYARFLCDETGLLEAGGYLLAEDHAIIDRWKLALTKCEGYADSRYRKAQEQNLQVATWAETAVYAKYSLAQFYFITEWYRTARNCVSRALELTEQLSRIPRQLPGDLQQLKVRLLLFRARCNCMIQSVTGIDEAQADLNRLQDLCARVPEIGLNAAQAATQLELRGLCKDALHQRAAAQAVFEECLDMRLKLHGTSRHLDVAQVQCHLSQVLMNRDKCTEAATMADEALKTRKALLPKDHSYIGKASLLCAKARSGQDRSRAQDLLRKAIAIGQLLPRVKPNLEHPLVADCRVCWANMMRPADDEVIKEARRMLAAEGDQDASFAGEDSVELQDRRKQALMSLQRKAYEHALQLYKAYEEEKGVQIAAMLEKLARFDAAELKVQPAIKQHREAHQLRKAHLGKHPTTAESARRLAGLLWHQAEISDSQDCDELRQEVIDLLREALKILENWNSDDDKSPIRERLLGSLLLALQGQPDPLCLATGLRGEPAEHSTTAHPAEPALVAELRNAVDALQTVASGIEREAQAQAQRYDSSFQLLKLQMERQHTELMGVFDASKQRISTLERRLAAVEGDIE